MKLSKQANATARAIVQLVEKSTGKTMHLNDCMQITGAVQTAINKSDPSKVLKEILRDGNVDDQGDFTLGDSWEDDGRIPIEPLHITNAKRVTRGLEPVLNGKFRKV